MTGAEPRRPAPDWRVLLAVVAASLAGPALALIGQPPAALPLVAAPVLALSLMAAGMITAAVAGRLGPGIGLALVGGGAVLGLMFGLGLPGVADPAGLALAMIIATASFAVRGGLFARAYPGRGWMIALFVVGGEAAMLVTATLLPPWLLLLLPAQWASTAIQAAMLGLGPWAAGAALIALAGTAATTLLVTRLLPRRWPYALMFTAWLALSALVWQRPAPPMPRAALFPAATAWLASGRAG